MRFNLEFFEKKLCIITRKWYKLDDFLHKQVSFQYELVEFVPDLIENRYILYEKLLEMNEIVLKVN